MHYQDPDVITKLLAESRVIAIVGLSPKGDRPSHGVAAYLQQHGYRIIPVNPAAAGTHILGEHCYATLTMAAAALQEQGTRIDLVDVFRKADQVEPIADESIAIHARGFWLQLGIVNQAAIDKVQAAGIAVVADRCTKIDHAIRHNR